MSEQKDRYDTGRWMEWLSIAILCALGWLTAWKIMSYATGQDPRIYFQVAKEISASGYSLAAISKSANWFAPGYPLLLAAFHDLFGYFAAYWINLPLFMLGLWPLVVLLRRIAGPHEIALILLSSFWLIWAGHPLNPHYLFLPFRGMIEWVFMFGAIAIAMPAFAGNERNGVRGRHAFWAGLLLTIGLAFRETIALVYGPLGFLWLWKGLRGDRYAWKGLVTMLAPLLITLSIFMAWRLSRGPLFTWQAGVWFSGLMRGGYDRPFQSLLMESLAMIRAELGFAGLFFLAVGTLLAARRRTATLFVLLATAVLLILFYAMFLTHVRFILSAVGFLAIVAGYGFALSVTALLGRLRSTWSRNILWLLVLALTALHLHAISRMETWGPRVTRADVNSLRKHPVAAARWVFIEKEHRYLVDALLAFTDASPKDPVTEKMGITNFQGSFFVRPLDDKGRLPMQRGIKGEDWLRTVFDLEPVAGDISMGGSRSEVFRMASWSKTLVSFEMPASSGGEAGVLWLDFKAGNAADRVQVDLRGREGVTSQVELHRPAGLVPLWVRSNLRSGSNVYVSVRSPLPLPADLDPVFVPAGVPRWFGMEQGRLPSVARMLGEGFEAQSILAKHGAAWRSHATLRIPALSGTAPSASDVAVTLRLLPRPASSSDIRGTLAGAGDPSATVDWRLAARQNQQRVTWKGRMDRMGDPPALLLAVDSFPPDCWYLRVEQMGIAFSASE